MANSPDLILVDGSSYLFRAFHALPPLVNSRGQPTGAVKGVINMIRSLIRSNPESHIAIVFDAKGKTFRNDIYADYKTHRPPMPDELRSQISPIHDIVKAMGLPLLVIGDVEADDVIGTLARRATEKGIDTLISTGDKDLAQLVNSHVSLINTMTNEVLDEAGVEDKLGVEPGQVVDYLALMGDKSDNIPGVPGVGPKTAVKWLLEYKNIEGVLENSEHIGGKIGERLRESIDLVRLSYKLATIRQDIELDIDIEKLNRAGEDRETLHDIFSDLEFKTWINELEEQGVSGPGALRAAMGGDREQDGAAPGPVAPDKTEYFAITSKEALEELIGQLETGGEFALTVEFEPAHFLDTKILGIGICGEAGKAGYIPLAHDREDSTEQLPLAHVLKMLGPCLENPEQVKHGYDLKLLAHVLQNHEINFQPFKSDVLIASYVADSVAVKHQLHEIARHYLDIIPVDLQKLTGRGRNRKRLGEIRIEDFTGYAAERADLILRLGPHLEKELSARGELLGIYKYYELPLLVVLQRMERAGIKVDRKVLEKQSRELATQLEKIQQQVFDLAGEEFNLGSPKQLQSILFDKLKLPVSGKTKTGQPSTAEPVLQELAQAYELPRLILEQRSLSKLKSTYTDKLPLEINRNTGRIHSTFQQAVAATGRLSSTDPNLQNIPIRTAEGRRVRRAFVPEKGMKLMTADYSQVELRIMAHLSRDRGLLEAFGSDKDVHRATAAEVFGVGLDEVTAEQRRRAKAINFGLIYGMSAFGLANQLKVPRRDAQEYVDRYFERYPGVRKYMDETQALADEKGYVETLFGRRLYLPEIHAGNAVIRKAAQRAAINAPMQGSAADIIKRAMIDIDHWLALGELNARMVLQVHDELVFEVGERDLELLAEGVRFRMISAASLDVALVVDVGVGNNWDEAH